MTTSHNLDAAAWRKSSHSGGGGEGAGGNSCLEVADDIPGVVPVRDSKAQGPHGPVVVFPAAAWSAFINRLKA
ncbi:DUF397 domain-containing protein [Streptomyces hiroshimensis]|uniref:DUF397 domain-containing protein n=1 Tax=Streptomyces hiroshimensis TaxID=66424 RepID=A0ABQ2YJC9_9ACTN|nr:DUF397 domain-containing protein [Streptomyces hiroshimensis]GGX84034.1 hypothetical protein GCM10010324_32030 [Streptomyces hiroshimensis]